MFRLALLPFAAAFVYEETELCCGWAQSAKASPDTSVDFTFSLKHQRLAKIHQIVADVSDPQSSKYGQYLSTHEISQLAAPHPEHVSVVENWLTSNGVSSFKKSGRTYEVSTTVQKAEALLSTRFYNIFHQDSNHNMIRASTFQVPDNVNEAVGAFFGLHGLPIVSETGVLTMGDDIAKVTPKVITNTYKISGVFPFGSIKNRQAVAEFQGQYMRQTDLVTFFKNLVPNAQPGDDKVYAFVGDKNEEESTTEASLDIQYIMGVAPHVKTEFWLYIPTDFCSDLKKWTEAILSDASTPLVHSVSYGWQGDLSELRCTNSEVSDIDANFALIAAKGITILFSSGDSGSGLNGATLWASWPASSPFVTAIGATRFLDQIVGHEEMATDQFGSGGGFSKMFDRSNATWQEAAVQHYLNNHPMDKYPPATYFSSTGRGTPDVSALGEGYQVYIGTEVISVGGTSASAPAFGGMVSLLNEARIQAGKPAMGFLNPFLYQNAAAFTDITKGTNAIGRGTGPVEYGFACAEGWDPATGLGTPKFDLLLAAALK